jgi:biotin carboxyl carrier protein
VPEYNIIIEKRTYQVELAKKEGKGLFEAKLNDKPVALKIEESETGTFSPLAIKVAGKTYQIEVDKIDRHAPFALKVNDMPFNAQLKEPKRIVTQVPIAQAVTKTRSQRGAAPQEGAVVAPMAGKIVSVRVKKGDNVNAGDVVCILEAMKMENEITATKTGTIQEVNVAEGTPVNEGDILATIK